MAKHVTTKVSPFAQHDRHGPAEDGLVRWLFDRTHMDGDAALNADIVFLTRTLPGTEARLARLSKQEKVAAQ